MPTMCLYLYAYLLIGTTLASHTRSLKVVNIKQNNKRSNLPASHLLRMMIDYLCAYMSIGTSVTQLTRIKKIVNIQQ